jgi:hypothetical protein
MSDQNEQPKAAYSLKLKSENIPIEDDHGIVQNYVLKELKGSQRNAYLGKSSKRLAMKRDRAGETDVTVRDYTGMCSDLLGLCLYGPDGILVKAEVIDEWPSEMQMDLFIKAQKMSGLDKKSEEDAKNS